MPRPSNTATTSRGVSATTTVLFLVVLILAFFPNLFAAVIRLPLSFLSRSPTQTNPAIPPTCTHCCNTPPLPPPSAQSTMSWFQKTISLPAASKGSYLVTDHVLSALPEVKQYRVGLLNLFVQHTSCALSLNENWDEDVRADMTDALDRIVEEDKGSRKGLYRHDAEGSDDMPAHIKSALVGASVTIPIRDGKLATGTWQGIWYLEFRAHKHSRKLVATIQGEKM